MARLGAKERAQLPDRAFAYVDSEGRRRLPIHDAAHVRNALARFGQVHFEDDAARERARGRLLRAAQRHGIMPFGFISAQLRPRQAELPTGDVTFVLADMEGSTELLARLGDDYAAILATVRRLVRRELRRTGGHEIGARGDDWLAAFAHPPAALDAALAIQRALRDTAWPDGAQVRLRVGLHRGRPALTEHGYVGLALHAVARICFAAHGGQVVLSGAVARALPAEREGGARLAALGRWRFRGLPEPVELLQVLAPDLPAEFPPLRSGTRA